MTIAPGSDIVLDALMAADPARSQAVTEKLSQLRPSRAGEFDAAAVGASASVPSTATGAAASVPALLAQRPPPRINQAAAHRGAVTPAYRKFEAFVLQTFIEAMLPRDSVVNFGKGVAGDVWRSMLAEQLGNAVANSGGVGIAKFLAAAHPDTASAAKGPAAHSPQAFAPTAAAIGAMRLGPAAMLDDSATST